MKSEISPYYYPTNIALVDDNEAFLNTLHLYLTRFFNCNTFTDPLNALKFANDLHATENIKDTHSPIDVPYINESVFDSVSEKQFDMSKSEELSVVVVDYDMPGINGVEFCSRINNPCVRKILLTGCATHRQVVTAFNENIIDYYIDKQEEDLLGTVRDIVIEMQKEYFRNRLHKLTMSLVKNEAPYFLDSALADFFDSTCKKLGVKEYYFIPKPSRFILRGASKESLLIVLTDKDLEEHINILRDEEAPESWIERLQSKQYVPYFESGDGFYTPETQKSLDPFLQATIVEGQENYYCALIDAPAEDYSLPILNLKTINMLH